MIRSSYSKLAVFFSLSFLIAWGTWIPTLLFPGFPKLFPLVGLFAPALAALITSWLSEGTSGMRKLLGRYLLLRFKVRLYALAILFMPVVYLLAIVLNILFFHYTSPIWTNLPLYFIAASFIWLMVINSGEEIGWRGFALPVLLERMSPITASALLGTAWGLWHLPLYLMPGQSSFPYPLFLLLTIGLSFVYTFLFLNTKGSLLAAVLLHAGTDVGARIFQLNYFTPLMYGTIDVLIFVTGALLLYLGQLSRSRDIALREE